MQRSYGQYLEAKIQTQIPVSRTGNWHGDIRNTQIALRILPRAELQEFVQRNFATIELSAIVM